MRRVRLTVGYQHIGLTICYRIFTHAERRCWVPWGYTLGEPHSCWKVDGMHWPTSQSNRFDFLFYIYTHTHFVLDNVLANYDNASNCDWLFVGSFSYVERVYGRADAGILQWPCARYFCGNIRNKIWEIISYIMQQQAAHTYVWCVCVCVVCVLRIRNEQHKHRWFTVQLICVQAARAHRSTSARVCKLRKSWMINGSYILITESIFVESIEYTKHEYDSECVCACVFVCVGSMSVYVCECMCTNVYSSLTLEHCAIWIGTTFFKWYFDNIFQNINRCFNSIQFSRQVKTVYRKKSVSGKNFQKMWQLYRNTIL